MFFNSFKCCQRLQREEFFCTCFDGLFIRNSLTITVYSTEERKRESVRVRKRQIGRKEKDRGEQEEGDKRRKRDTWQEKYKEGKEEEDRKKKYRKKVEDGDGQHSTVQGA